MNETTYGFGTLVDLPFEEAVARVTELLGDEGFGVLTRIDVHGTLKAKLGVHFRPYVILGACNPHLAHRALTEEPEIGLLLPCNVVVQKIGAGAVAVSIADPQVMFGLVRNPRLEEVATQADTRLQRVIERLRP